MFHRFTHQIQIAHRLSETFPGSKCENIHGHSLDVEIRLYGDYDNGVLTNRTGKPLEFGEVKKKFRGYLDEQYDHRLLLNKTDPWAQPIWQFSPVPSGEVYVDPDEQKFLPGLALVEGDPTTERLVAILSKHFAEEFDVTACEVYIQETASNGVGGVCFWSGSEYKVEGAY